LATSGTGFLLAVNVKAVKDAESTDSIQAASLSAPHPVFIHTNSWGRFTWPDHAPFRDDLLSVG